jgi:hypothetical protein
MQGARRRSRPVAAGALALLAVAGVACSTRSPLRIRPGPVVQEQRLGISREALQKIAVVPFWPTERVGRLEPVPGGASPPTRWEIAALIGNFVAEAIAGWGTTVIPPNDVELAFAGEGHPVPRLDARASADLAGRSFGAVGVVLGRVTRYREREGSAAGATVPASVAFEVTLHEVPTGRRLWTGRFDETQQSITASVMRARQYPGGGTRWLSAAEFARWGAEEVAKSMLSGP